MHYSYDKNNKTLAHIIADKLENWGEVILHLASGQVAEIHKGDDGNVMDDAIIFKDNNGDEHTILYSQIERITTHRASIEE